MVYIITFIVPVLYLSYKYNPKQSQLILAILFEKKEDEKIGYNKLYLEMDNRLYPNKINKKKPKTSKSHFDKNIKYLLSYTLIQKKEDKESKLKKRYFSLTEIGKYCCKHKYMPEEYMQLYLLCFVIAIKAYLGVREIKEKEYTIVNTGTASKKATTTYLEHKRGITVKDILENTDTIIKHNLNIKVPVTEEEKIQNYFQFLEDKKILERESENGEFRYQIHQDYKLFVIECGSNLFDPIQKKISTKWKYVEKKPEQAELKWHNTFFGKEYTNTYRKECHQIKKETIIQIRKEKSQDIIHYNKIIKDNYDLIKDKYKDKFKEWPGFVDTIISLICPNEIIESIEKENKKSL